MSMLTMPSAGLRKKFILTNFGVKLYYKNWASMQMWGEASLGGPYLPVDVHVPPLVGVAQVGLWRVAGVLGITVDGELHILQDLILNVWQLVLFNIPV